MADQSLQIAHQVSVESQVVQAPPDPNELTQLSTMIKAWREVQKEADDLKTQIKEKTKRCKAMEEVILRIMKKNNIGALDLQSMHKIPLLPASRAQESE